VHAYTDVVLRFAVRDAVVSDSGPRLRRAYAQIDAAGASSEVRAQFMGGDLYRVVIPGQPMGTSMKVSLCAEDRAGNLGRGELITYEVGSLATGLAIRSVETDVEITWSNGVLQILDAIGNTWSDVEGATNPYRVEPTANQRFFRVKVEP
jgi:hypothetical protein